jgi:hypothetical protein
MSDEQKRPEEEPEVEAHGPTNLGPTNLAADAPTNLAHEEDEGPDVEAHGPTNLAPTNLANAAPTNLGPTNA